MTKRFIISSSLAMLLALLTLVLGSCGSESNDTPQPEPTLAPLQLTISVPQTTSKKETRIGDPGENTDESDDWDRLTIIVAYTNKTKGNGIVDVNPEQMVYYDTFTKDDFDKGKTLANGSELSKADENGFHTYTMYLPLGTVKVYGVTYSANATNFDLQKELDAIAKDGTSHISDIENLKISNDYTQSSNGIDLNKFLSVATGYARKVNASDGSDVTAGGQLVREIEISKNSADIENKFWRMPLTRLATKIDIQWDAKGAYAADNNGKIKYTDVKVEGFTYDGGANNLTDNEKSGYGRLFPDLATQEAIGGKKEFINTTPISKRNGRVYHYIFPDGSTSPSVTFKLTTQEENKDAVSKTYSFLFTSFAPLAPGTWYKINTTIKGQSASTETPIKIEFKTGN